MYLLIKRVIATRIYKNWLLDVIETAIYFNLLACFFFLNMVSGNQITVAYSTHEAILKHGTEWTGPDWTNTLIHGTWPGLCASARSTIIALVVVEICSSEYNYVVADI